MVSEAGPIDVAFGAAEIIAAPRMVVLGKGPLAWRHSLRDFGVGNRGATRPPNGIVRIAGPFGFALPVQRVTSQGELESQPDLTGGQLSTGVTEAIGDLGVARVVHTDGEAAGEVVTVIAVPFQEGAAISGVIARGGEAPAAGIALQRRIVLHNMQGRAGEQDRHMSGHTAHETAGGAVERQFAVDRKSTRLNSSHLGIS